MPVHNNVLERQLDISEVFYMTAFRRQMGLLSLILTGSFLPIGSTDPLEMFNRVSRSNMALNFKRLNGREYSWQDSITRPKYDLTSTAIAVGSTTFTGTAASLITGVTNFRIGDILYFETTGETVTVTAVTIAAGVATYTITRSTNGLTAGAYPLGSTVYRLAFGQLEGSGVDLGNINTTTASVKRSNFTQIIRQDFSVTASEMNQNYYGIDNAYFDEQDLIQGNISSVTASLQNDYDIRYSNLFALRMLLSVNDFLNELNHAIYLGRSQVPTATQAGRFDGLIRQIIAPTTAINTNAGGVAITKAIIDNIVRQLLERGCYQMDILCSPEQAARITGAFPTYQQVINGVPLSGINDVMNRVSTELSVGAAVTSLNYVVGGMVRPLNIIVDMTCPKDKIIIGDFRNVKALTNRRSATNTPVFSSLKNATTPGVDGASAYIIGEYTLEVKAVDSTMAIIQNLLV